MTTPSLGSRVRLALALAALALAVPATAQAQYYFNGYFGQNKVQYSKFDFQIIQTDRKRSLEHALASPFVALR